MRVVRSESSEGLKSGIAPATECRPEVVSDVDIDRLEKTWRSTLERDDPKAAAWRKSKEETKVRKESEKNDVVVVVVLKVAWDVTTVKLDYNEQAWDSFWYIREDLSTKLHTFGSRNYYFSSLL